jgi:hypothetical protein
MPHIGLEEQAIAVAGRSMHVHATQIVESQKAARIDRHPQVLSIDLCGQLDQSIGVERVIRSGGANSKTRPDDLSVTMR